MQGIGGLIIIALIYFVMWILSNAAKKGQEKNAAEVQRKILAAQQQGAAGRAEPKKKYRQIEELRGRTGEAFVPAVSPPPMKRESVFDEQIDGASDVYADNAPGLVTDTAPIAQQISENANPIAQEIMAMMTTPQSMQQVVILNEIFNRPKSVME
jgi:hypothetical protein